MNKIRTYNLANSVLIKNAILLIIFNNTFNLRDTDEREYWFVCIITAYRYDYDV